MSTDASPALALRLHLLDGTPYGMRSVSISGADVVALIAPRADVPRLRDREEVGRPGVYVLVGPREESGLLPLYVGQTENICTRIDWHATNKQFWTWVAVFVSGTDHLTRGHALWVERALYDEFVAGGRAELYNGNTPPGSQLGPFYLNEANILLRNARLLLEVIGVDAFAAPPVARADAEDGPTPLGVQREVTLTLTLAWAGARAECVVRGSECVVLRGSTARAVGVPSLRPHVVAERDALVRKGVLVASARDPSLLEFAQDYAFKHLTGAASVVAGNGISGWEYWMVKGTSPPQSYKEWTTRREAGGA